MSVPNEHSGVPDRRSLTATSDEGAPSIYNTAAPLQHPHAPQSFQQWKAPPAHHVVPPHYGRTPLHEPYNVLHHVDGQHHLLGQKQVGQTYHQTPQYPALRPPSPLVRNAGFHELDSPIASSNPSHRPQPLQSSFACPSYLNEHHAHGPNIVNTGSSLVWDTDGTGRNLRNDTVCSQSYSDPPPLTYVNPSAFEHQPSVLPPTASCQPFGAPDASTPRYVPASCYMPPPGYIPASGYTSTPGYMSTPSHMPPPGYMPATGYVPPPGYHQSSRALSIASSPSLNNHNVQSSPMPPIQQWSTDSVSAREPLLEQTVDEETRHKQEVYRQKGAARRHSIAAGMLGVHGVSQKPMLTREEQPQPKAKRSPPTKRRRTNKMMVPETQHSQPPPFIGLPPLASDELTQPIVDMHENYKWSVFHYELQSVSGFDYAESWIQQLFEVRLQPEYQHRHVSHITRGFIKDGTRYSILVLHNATNPFEYDTAPNATITIGVYGYHWYNHSEIHWTTIASDQRQLLKDCVASNILVEKHKWTSDNPKATEKRFHRAYWLAANRHPLKGLLNHATPAGQAHDFIDEKGEDDPDEDFSISEADLSCAWNITEEEAAAAWEKIQSDVEVLGEEWGVGSERVWEHLVVGSSEWV